MNKKLQQKLQITLQTEVIKKQILQYLQQKGIDNPEKSINPMILQDLPLQIPSLQSCVEVQPTIEDINPQTNSITLQWNLYVNGVNRMNLGSTTGTNLNQVGSQVQLPTEQSQSSYNWVTADRLIGFISGCLARHPVKPTPDQPLIPTGPNMVPNAGGYYTKRPV